MYHATQGPMYSVFSGKYNTQGLHFWLHNPSSPYSNEKWEYVKDSNWNENWYYFYNALHKDLPAGEKIVDWTFHWTNIETDQLWVYIMRYNGL